MGNVVIAIAVFAVIGLAIFAVVKNRKKGGCGCGCANCHMKSQGCDGHVENKK